MGREPFIAEHLIGERIAGRFVIERQIGSGPLSSAFRARDELLERRVTVKLFHPHHSDDVDVVASQLELATSVARLSHPHIGTVIDRGEHEGLPFVVLEYVRGENLQERIDRYAPLDIHEVIGFGLGIARALAYAHAQGVVHGNLRPENVLISEDRDVKIVDFGGGSYLASLTGAAAYIAPEQRLIEGIQRTPTPLDDIHALGVLLHVALTDTLPVPGRDAAHIELMRPDAPWQLVQVIARATEPDPAMRTSSMQELASELAGIRGRGAAQPGVLPGFVSPEHGLDQSEIQSTPQHSEPWETVPFAPIRPEVGADNSSGSQLTQQRAEPAASRPRNARETRARLLAWSMLLVPLAGVVLIAIVIAGERGQPNTNVDRNGGSIVAQEPVVLTSSGSFDPFSPDPDKTERQDLVGFLIDGQPGTDEDTSWQTEGYEVRLPKAGVGAWVAADDPFAAAELQLRTDLEGWGYEVYATNDPRAARTLDDWTQISQRELAADDGRPVALNTDGVRYRAYLIWITRLAVDTTDTNKLRARIGEVSLRSS